MSKLLERWRLLGRVLADPKLVRTDAAVAWWLLEMWNPRDGTSWPSYETLVAKTKVHRSTVIESVGRLVKQGYFERVSGGGRGHSNTYRPLLETVASTGRIRTDETVAPSLPFPEPDTVASNLVNGRPEPVETVVSDPSKRSPAPDPNPLKNPPINPPMNPSTQNHVDEAFEEWWRQYPKQRRADRKRCAAKYRKVVESGEATTAQLLKAVMRYAASSDVARGYACAPMVWLNKCRWEIEPHGSGSIAGQQGDLGELLRQRKEGLTDD